MFVRSAEVTRIVGLLLADRSVSLIGDRWSGRSTILERVRKELLGQNKHVLVVRGIGLEVPLEAVRIALPTASRKNLGPRGATVSAMLDELERTSRLEPMVVMVDDSDLLDRASWVVLESLHKSTGIPILATGLRRDYEDPPRPSLMTIAHPAVQIVLEDIGFEVTHGLLEARMDGPLDPGLAGTIHNMSGGVPGVAISILESAVDTGIVRRKDGVWHAIGALWNDDLVGVFRSLLETYPRNLQEAMELLSIVGVTEWRTAETIVGQETLETLEGHGLVRVLVTDGRALMAVTPGGIIDFFRNQPLSARRMRLIESASSSLSEIPADDRVEYVQNEWGRLASASGEVPMWHSVATPVLVRMFAEDLQMKVSAAERRWHDEPSMRSAVDVLVLQLNGGVDLAAAEEILAHKIPELEGTPLDEVELRWLSCRALLAQGADLADARRLLDDGIRADFAGSEALALLTQALEIEFVSVSTADLDRLRASATGTDYTSSLARVILAAALTVRGDGEGALEVIESAQSAARTSLVDMHLPILKGLALLAARQHQAAIEWASSHLEAAMAALDRRALAGHAYVAAMGNAILTKYNEATDVATLPLLVGARSGSLLLSPDRPLLILVWALAAVDDRPSAAEGFAAAAEATHPRMHTLPFSDDVWAQSMSHVASGQQARGGDDFREIAETSDARGYTFASSIAHFLSEYSYLGPHGQGLPDEAPRLEGDLFDVYLAAKRYSVNDDAAGVERAAQQLRRLHALPAAARFFGQAARLYREAGAREDAARVRNLLDEMTPESVGAPAMRWESPLTRRESELVQLIAAGLTNNEIATRLVLSIRTVESHINNIRRKTGVADRADMAELSITR